jgi:glycosyltransferase involved in cell wall biosynthesis
MIKVAYDSQIFAQQHFGGVSRYFCELAKCVTKTPCFEGRIVAPLHRNQHLLGSGNLNRGNYFNPTGRLAGKAMRSINDIISPWELRKYGPDILHETYYSEYNNRQLKCARVVTVFDMINEKLEPETSLRDKETRAKRASVSRADAVICISEHTRRDLIDLFNVPENKTYVVHLGFALSTQSEEGYKLDLQKPFLLYVGKRGGYKNFDALLSAFAASTKLRSDFVLVAFGGGEFNIEECHRISALGLEPNQVVHIAGHDQVLRALYRAARCFIYPSIYEGFGIPPLEAMSFGCPVVSSNTSSLPEVVGDAAIKVDPSDIEVMRDAIETVVLDEDVRRELISKGAMRIERFSWSNCAEETIKIYRSLI